MLTKSRDHIEKQLAEALAQKDQAQKNRSILEEKRRASLLDGGNSAVLDKLDSEIASTLKTESRTEERAGLLRAELKKVEADEAVSAQEALRQDTLKKSQLAEKIQRELDDLFSQACDRLEQLTVLGASIDSANLTLGQELRVPNPRDLRAIAFEITSAKEVIEEQRPVGVYDASGRNLDLNAPTVEKIKRTIPSEIRGGFFPRCLTETVVLPPVFRGGPEWNTEKRNRILQRRD